MLGKTVRPDPVGVKNPSPPRDCKAEAAHIRATRQGSHTKIVSALEVNPVRVVLEKSSQATAAIRSTRDLARSRFKKSDGAAGRLQTAVTAKPGDRRNLQPVRFSSALRTTFKLPRVRERRTK